MEVSTQISIISDDKSGLAEIMTAYLSFYSNQKINIHIKGKSRMANSIAHQVLKEDGIDPTENSSKTQKGQPGMLIYINRSIEDPNKNIPQRYYNFNEPVQKSNPDQLLESYRTIREAIKKESIQLVGELHII